AAAWGLKGRSLRAGPEGHVVRDRCDGTCPLGHGAKDRELEVVDPALGLAGARPAAAALVVARGAGGARLAADAGVAGVEQGVVGDVVIEEVAPGVLARPRDQRRDLDDEAAVAPRGGAEDRGVLARDG